MKYNVNRRKCLHLLYTNVKIFILFLITTIIVSFGEVFSIFIIKSYIDNISLNDVSISSYVFALVITTIITLLFIILRNVFKSKLAYYVRKKLVQDAYSSILNADINDLKRKEVKDAVNNITDNCDYISEEYIKKQVLLIYELIISIIVLSLGSLYIEPILSLIILISLAVYYISIKTSEFALKKMNLKKQELESKNKNGLFESYDLIKDIKLKNGYNKEQELFVDELETFKKAQTKESFIELISSKLLNISFVCINIAIVLGLGGVLYKTGKYDLTAGSFVYFVAVVPWIFYLIYSCIHKKISLNYINKQNDELNIIYSLHLESKSEPISEIDDIQNLSFNLVSYISNNKEVLSNISFELQKNEKIGILCSDSSSKDALYNIITKINKPTSGEVHLNENDYLKIRTPFLRSIISSVSFDNKLFNKSIKENIMFPDEFDGYRYNDALNKTGLKELLKILPNGDNQIVDESLYMNYKDIYNRIIFANAFYRDAKIYLFNDASKDFIYDNEKMLFDEVSRLKGKMVINITDKVYLLSNYDKILILEDGKQIEYGKYDDLMARKDSHLYKRVKNVKIKK